MPIAIPMDGDDAATAQKNNRYIFGKSSFDNK